MKKKIINDDMSSLSHTKWNCMYHIVFTPKYRRKVNTYTHMFGANLESVVSVIDSLKDE